MFSTSQADQTINIINPALKDELSIQKKLSVLERKKEEITQRNKDAGTQTKGFSANYHNYKRTGDNYSIAERQFKELLDSYGIEFVHEFKVKVRDICGANHTYHLDFYIPSLKLCIEINPLFHYTYDVVAIRDQLRAKLLYRKQHIKTMDIKVYFRTRNGKTETFIDYEKAFKVIETIQRRQRKLSGIHRETLLGYVV